MVDEWVVSGVVFAGCVLGSFGRAMFPYLRKLKEQEDVEAEAGPTAEKPVKFQRKYTYSAIFSAVVALFIGMTLYPTLVDSAMNAQVQEIEITNGTASTDVVPVEDVQDTTTTPGASNTGLAGIFMASFLTAWGTNSIINNVIATGKATSENVEPGKFTKPQEGGTTATTTATTNPTTTQGTAAGTTKSQATT